MTEAINGIKGTQERESMIERLCVEGLSGDGEFELELDLMDR